MIRETTISTVNNNKIIDQTEYQYDAAGNVISIYDTVLGTETILEYDEMGNEISSKEIERFDNETEGTGADGPNISYIEELEVEMSETSTLYVNGNPVSVEEEYLGLKEISTEAEHIYDDMGREIRSTTNGVVTETTYDFLGRVTKTVVTEPGMSSQTVTKTYDDNGSLISETESGGVKKEYTYDSRNRVVTEKTTGTGIDTRIKTTSYSYGLSVDIDEGDRTRTENVVYIQTIRDTDGNIVSETYIDACGNTVKEVAGDSYIDYTYDNSGNVVVTVAGNNSSEDKQITLQLYDEEGNNTATVTQPLVNNDNYTLSNASIVTKSTYDDKGNICTQTDGEGIVTAFDYDNKNRIIECNIIEDVSSDEEDIIDLKVKYATDADSAITTNTITDANGNTKEESINSAGLTTSTVDEAGNKNEEDTSAIVGNFEYDSLGRIIQETYGGESYVTYSYENYSERISERKAYKAGNIESIVYYTYDDKGRLTSVTCEDAEGVDYCKTEYVYDVEDKLTEESITYEAGLKQTTKYSYDTEGRIISKEYPSNTGLGTINYEYDIYGKCTKILKGNNTVREYIYDDFDRISQIKDYSKPGSTSFIITSYGYDDLSRVISMETVDDSENVLESFTYHYDKNDQITERTHVNNLPEEGKKINETREYEYDEHGNLIRSSKCNNTEPDTTYQTYYTYDSVGNRTSMQVGDFLTEYEYNGLNQLISMTSGDSSTEYEYDNKGNQIKEVATVSTDTGGDSIVTTFMEYAVTGEIISLTKTAGSTTELTQSNVYNHDGIRISRTENGTTREYYYDGGVVAYTKDASTTFSNILSPEGATVGTYRGNDYYTYLNDIQGSITNLVKEDESLAAAYDYTDFGETTEITGGNFDNQICYAGGIYDKETELYYLNARYYDPATGRFISQDTYRGEMNDPGQWHLYAYCANNPINYVDPSGHARYGSRIVQESASLKSSKKGGMVIHVKNLKWERNKVNKKIKVTCLPTVYYKCDVSSYGRILDRYIDYYRKWKKTVKIRIICGHYRLKVTPAKTLSQVALNFMGTKPTKYVIFKIVLNGNAKSKSKVCVKSTYSCKPENYNPKNY